MELTPNNHGKQCVPLIFQYGFNYKDRKELSYEACRKKERFLDYVYQLKGLILVCPNCQTSPPDTHLVKTEVFSQENDNDNKMGIHVNIIACPTEEEFIKIDRDLSQNPSPRRDSVRLYFSCEHCRDLFSIVFLQHKGRTDVFVTKEPGDQDDINKDEAQDEAQDEA